MIDPLAPVVFAATEIQLRSELQDLLSAIKGQTHNWRPPPRQDAHEILRHYRDAGQNELVHVPRDYEYRRYGQPQSRRN